MRATAAIPKASSSVSGWNVSRLARTVLILAALGYAGFLMIAPLAALAYGALEEGVLPALQSLFQGDVGRAFLQTIWICALVAGLHTVFGTVIAWVIVRHKFKGKHLLNGLIDVPFAISPVVVGYMLLLLFGRNGVLYPAVSALGIQVAFALPGMILATLVVTLPFMIREMIPVIGTLDAQQERAASTLGAHPWQIFRKITFPYLRWGLLYGLTLTTARALGEFGAILVIGGGIQGRTETVTVFIFRALDERQYVAAYSAALALGLISLATIYLAEWIKRRWLDKG